MKNSYHTSLSLGNGKNDNFDLEDFLHIANEYSIKKSKNIIHEINQSFQVWRKIAGDLNISKKPTN